MLNVYDRNRVKVAVLDKAFNITEEQRINSVNCLRFTLPDNDPKNIFCQPFHLVQYMNTGDLYRIIGVDLECSEAGTLTYQCEHVISLLMDNVMFGYHVVGNLGMYTEDVLRYVLSKQKVQNWILERCEFRHQYEYAWEQENLLAALFSVPACFTGKYIWKYDTSRYPWRLSLLKLDESGVPGLYIRGGRNLLSITKQSDLRNICTRIYPLGAGEGVNQLGITKINGGLSYLQSPQSYIDKYGLVERVWVDRRYEDAGSLKQAAQVMLDELQEPYTEYGVEFAQLKGGEFDTPVVGKIVQVYDSDNRTSFKTFIVGITRCYDNPAKCSLSIANKPKDIAESIADLADRQRIEMTYSQGATQIYALTGADNADNNTPYEIRFYLDRDMRYVNSVKCKIKLSRFRAYSQATVSSNQSTETSSSGGGSSTTTSSGGGSSKSTASGGGESTSSSSASETSTGKLTDDLRYVYTTFKFYEQEAQVNPPYFGWTSTNAGHEHSTDNHRHGLNVTGLNNHTHSMPHTHSVNVAAHSHGFTTPDHNHSLTIPAHSHTLTIPGHSHSITPGIFFFGGASSFGLYINGQLKATISSTDADLDITDYLVKDGSIPRGGWQTIGIQPNGLARVEISVNVMGFIQSRGDRTV